MRGSLMSSENALSTDLKLLKVIIIIFLDHEGLVSMTDLGSPALTL